MLSDNTLSTNRNILISIRNCRITTLIPYLVAQIFTVPGKSFLKDWLYFSTVMPGCQPYVYEIAPDRCKICTGPYICDFKLNKDTMPIERKITLQYEPNVMPTFMQPNIISVSEASIEDIHYLLFHMEHLSKHYFADMCIYHSQTMSPANCFLRRILERLANDSFNTMASRVHG